jgi:hypothetical protein
MSKDTYSALDNVCLASISNAQMYLCYLLCRVILLFFHLRQNHQDDLKHDFVLSVYNSGFVVLCGCDVPVCVVDICEKSPISRTRRTYGEYTYRHVALHKQNAFCLV